MMEGVDKSKSNRVGYYLYNDVILGKGNFATVHLARHKMIGCDVALKVINVDDIEEEYVSRNLTREARILRDLRHPNIIRLYETVKSVNLYCLSLELIRGVNLYQYMKKQENCRISERLARVFFYQTLSAVEYMHRLHVIHRDLKQENILIESGHVVKIVDFGLSNIYYPCYRPRTHCGSVEYAAPELFRSQSAYGSAADLWSLGVILYAMVVGKMPFMFSRESPSSEESTQKRELFVQRISKGLMQENWELMEDLSPDCWNLLHDLLQPDQLRRIRIEEAITHHWITKDVYLKKRLPQKRRDLQRKFQPEIVQFLADKLNTSKGRIEKNICVSQESKIACMFYIVRDTLVKDVLYPPKDFEASFLFRFEYWRQNRYSLLSIELNSGTCILKDQPKSVEKIRYSSEKSQELAVGSTFKTSVSKPNAKVSKNLKYSYSNKTNSVDSDYGSTTKGICRSIASNIEDSKDDTEQIISSNPYRSYRNSRPENVKILERKAAYKLPDARSKSDCLESEKVSDTDQPIHNQQLQSSQSNTVKRNSLQKYQENSKVSKVEKSCIQPKIKSYANVKIPNKSTKSTNSNERKQCSAKLRPKTFLKTDDSNLKFSELPKKKDTTSKAMKISAREQTPKKIGENGIILLKRQQRLDTPDKSDGMKKIMTAGNQSRIPIQNMRYGPPAAFSQSANFIKEMQSKKSTVADRMSFSRGDTNEKLV